MFINDAHGRRDALARSGVWTDGYLPLLRYLGGLGPSGASGASAESGAFAPADVGLRPWALALVTDDALIVHACIEELCVTPSVERLWQGLGPELGRISKADVESIHVIPIDAGEFRAQRVVTRYLFAYLNAKLAAAYPSFLGQLEMRWYQAVVAVRCATASGAGDIYFGVPPAPGVVAVRSDLTRRDLEAFAQAAMPADWRGPAAELVRAYESLAPASAATPNPDTIEAQEGVGRAMALMNALQQVIDAAPRGHGAPR